MFHSQDPDLTINLFGKDLVAQAVSCHAKYLSNPYQSFAFHLIRRQPQEQTEMALVNLP